MNATTVGGRLGMALALMLGLAAVSANPLHAQAVPDPEQGTDKTQAEKKKTAEALDDIEKEAARKRAEREDLEKLKQKANAKAKRATPRPPAPMFGAGFGVNAANQAAFARQMQNQMAIAQRQAANRQQQANRQRQQQNQRAAQGQRRAAGAAAGVQGRMPMPGMMGPPVGGFWQVMPNGQFRMQQFPMPNGGAFYFEQWSTMPN